MQKCLDLIVSPVLDRCSNCTLLSWSGDHQPGFSHILFTPILLSKESQEETLLLVVTTLPQSCYFQPLTSEYSVTIFSLEAHALDLLLKRFLQYRHTQSGSAPSVQIQIDNLPATLSGLILWVFCNAKFTSLSETEEYNPEIPDVLWNM